mgnify:CR=1 FL=1
MLWRSPRNRKLHTAEQIIRKLRTAEQLIVQCKIVSNTCRPIEETQSTYQRFLQQYGGIQVEMANRLTQLEKENVRLINFVADVELAKPMILPQPRRCPSSWPSETSEPGTPP